MADNEEDERDTYAKKRRKGTRRPHSRLGIGLLCLVIGLVLGVIGHIAFINYNPPDTPENQPEILQASTVLERIKAENEMVGASQRYNITEKETDKNHIDTLLGTIDIRGGMDGFGPRLAPGTTPRPHPSIPPSR